MPDSLGDISESTLGYRSASLEDGEQRVLQTVEANAAALTALLEHVSDIRDVLANQLPLGSTPLSSEREHAGDEDSGLKEENEALRGKIADLETRLSELEQQNIDLASQVASETVRNTVGNSTDDSNGLSWEDRKRLILQQMEEDSFDAEAFVSSLQNESAADAVTETPEGSVQFGSLDPAAFIDQLYGQMAQRDQEINHLRTLLDQRGESANVEQDGYAVGAAAIGQMLDADELIQEERDRLQQLQREWEEKFREGEIEASLERAKLSRERQELARKQAEVEEQLEHLRREVRQHEGCGGNNSRRWLAKLGLTDSDSS